MRPWLGAAAGIAAAIAVVSGADAALPQFVDIARQAGVIFHHTNGASADKHLVETMGSGGLFFDYDSDGWPDIFIVDGGSIADPAANQRARHRLFHNRGNGTFEDVTDRSGIRHRQYGMGACSGDFDGDGRPDLYVTGYGANRLYRNQGNGAFADVTATAHVGDSRWSTGCAFADLDGDGDLDLWVTNYVDADRANNPFCGDAKAGVRFYCHPLKYEPLANTVYRNDGNGVFTDVTAASGVGRLRSNGLGVVIVDYDNDGRPDVFVANDTMPNFLFHNDGSMRFTEKGLVSGIAVAADGRARAGMGIDTGDYDGDGRLDLVITNLDFEMHTLDRGLDRGLFAYATTESGVGFPTLPFVGFGVAFLDYDNDGLLDIAIADGHILDNAPLFRAGSTYMQRKLLFRNTTGRHFEETGRMSGPAFAVQRVSRGLAVADIDNDGDLDLLITNNGQDAELLRNDGGNRGNWLQVRLRGRAPNSDAIGARVRVTTGTRTQFRDVKAGSSYLSQNDLRAHFGLGTATRVDRLEVVWPGGATESLVDVAANQIVTIQQNGRR
ncbi:MAG TPA: CRTAC1 family protein [Vicinamibacterales bacterium]|nr:CRTAC1 family protein [Vicinamibacterales bacterium]